MVLLKAIRTSQLAGPMNRRISIEAREALLFISQRSAFILIEAHRRTRSKSNTTANP